MDWESAKNHCIERNWQWSLEFINQAQNEMEELEDKVKQLEVNSKSSMKNIFTNIRNRYLLGIVVVAVGTVIIAKNVISYPNECKPEMTPITMKLKGD